MRVLFTTSIILFAVLISSAQRREFHPTIDVGLNGGVTYGNFSQNKSSLKNKGLLKVGGLSLMANTGFNRHILEFGIGNNINEKGIHTIWGGDHYYTLLPSILNFNYTFARELYAYYPACMIRNQLLLGLHFNTEVFMGNQFFSSDYSGPFYTTQDYGRYSADLTLITDYHLNKNNYLVLQLYAPILTYFVRPVHLEGNPDGHYELDDRLNISKSYFFKDGALGWINKFSKLGVNVTYRLLLTDMVGLQLKYNGRLNSISPANNNGYLPQISEIKENYHQITLGIVGHIVRPPVEF